jgi:hypothetical protein
MRIAYVLTSDTAKFLGSTTKIANQIDAWRLFGHEVEAFARTPDLSPSVLNSHRYVKKGFLANLLGVDCDLVKDVEKFNPDIVYMRNTVFNRTYYTLQRRYNNVLEVNTHDLQEYKFIWQKSRKAYDLLRYLWAKLTRKNMLLAASGIVFITNELRKKYFVKNFEKPAIIVPNSIPLSDDKTDLIKQHDNSSNKINIFFIGSPGIDWHGEDKLLSLSKKLGDQFHFHIVGLDFESTENVTFYGYLKKNEYLKILKKCHVCFSTFALHRKGLNECSTIKFTEYVKFGFPTILPYKETAFVNNETPDWILEIPNTPEVVDDSRIVENIRKFCLKNKSRVVIHSEKKDIVSAESIEKKRLDFLMSIAKGTVI